MHFVEDTQPRNICKPQVFPAIPSPLHTGIMTASHVAIILKLFKRGAIYGRLCHLVTGDAHQFPAVRRSASVVTLSGRCTPIACDITFCSANRDARRLPHTQRLSTICPTKYRIANEKDRPYAPMTSGFNP